MRLCVLAGTCLPLSQNQPLLPLVHQAGKIGDRWSIGHFHSISPCVFRMVNLVEGREAKRTKVHCSCKHDRTEFSHDLGQPQRPEARGLLIRPFVQCHHNWIHAEWKVAKQGLPVFLILCVCKLITDCILWQNENMYFWSWHVQLLQHVLEVDMLSLFVLNKN